MIRAPSELKADAGMLRASVSFPAELHETLELIAKQKMVSVAWVVREAMEQYVARQWPLFGAVNNGAAGSVNITVSGAQLGDYAEAAFSIALPAGVIVTAKVSATDTVTVSVGNLTGSTQTISSATIVVKVVPQ